MIARPQLLPTPLDAAISMVEMCPPRPEVPQPLRAELLRNDLRQQGPLIERLIQEILALGRD